eukprot:TRINITY_DN4374_c0_g1_i1.p1 TRINITY_DN4374_c0_g1~~TRINITY_DN4374_c0_g1_i1.p1  ORF type:complete len:860 (-),score=311.13 TRINITY_DN4374_c0_g1_i1:55-2634(-)
MGRSCGCNRTIDHSDGFHSIEGFCKTKNNEYAPHLSLEPVHMEITSDLNIEKKTAVMKVVTTLLARRDAKSIKFDGVGFNDLVVESDSPLEWFYDGKKISVSFHENVPSGDTRKVTVRYVVQDPVCGLHFGMPNETHRNLPRFVATDHETEKARYWLACVDAPTVRTKLDFFITSSDSDQILANGLLVGENVEGERKTAHWKLEQPCPSYLICFGAGKFSKYVDETVDNVPIEYYGVEGITEEDLKRSFELTPNIMKWMVKKFGVKFPYPKYFQFAFPEQGGAMENISITTWDDDLVCDERWATEFLYITHLVNVHEMGHSYHGDMLTVRHFEHAWLKESWATYTEMLWIEDNWGNDKYQHELYDARRRYFTESEDYVRPIVSKKYDSSWDMFDRHLYPGGAWRIHMLRKIVGDSTFFNAVTDYLQTFAFKTVETDDFRRVLEKHSGLNLTRFFDEWLYSLGYPKIKGSFEYDTESKTVTLELKQTQVDDKKRVGLFSFDLDVELVDSEGKKTLKTARFDGEERVVLYFQSSSKPKRIAVDPKQKVLFSLEMNPGEELLNNSMKEGGNLFEKVWAADELIKIGSRGSFKKIEEAMREEKFYGVRMEVGGLLADSKSPFAPNVLAQIWTSETEPYAQSALSAHCSHVKDPSILKASLSFLTEEKMNSLPYGTVAGALEALGTQRDPSHFEFLVEKAQNPHFRIAAGALRGVSKYRNDKAFDVLIEKLSPKYSKKLRGRFVRSFGDLVVSLDTPNSEAKKKRALEKLTEILRENELGFEGLAFGTMSALQKIGSEGSVEDLEGLKSRMPHQDHPEIDRTIERIQKKDSNPNQQLKKDLEDALERIKKLEGKVQDEEAKKEK